MFELPEFVTLAGQINETITGKVIQKGSLGNSPHRFVWYNRSADEFDALTRGRTVGTARAKGKWLFVPLEPGYVLVLGECGGKLLFHPAGSPAPKKFHLCLRFEDGSALSAMTQMWGAMELYEQGEEVKRQYIRDMRPTPTDPSFTADYLAALIADVGRDGKRTAKGLLTQEQLIPGLGNAIAQDILFRAGLHPKRPLADLKRNEIRKLHGAIVATVNDVIAKGGRSDEVDLHNAAGGYQHLMDKNAAGHPCPKCGTKVEKLQYLGGACYFCPSCQRQPGALVVGFE